MKYVPVINDFFMPNADYIIATAWPTAYDVAKLSDKKEKNIILFRILKFGMIKKGDAKL